MDAATQEVPRVAPAIGAAMRRLRKARGISQEQLARKVEPYLTRAQVGRIELGEETKTSTLDRVLWAMGYDASDLWRELGATRVKRQGRRPISEPIQATLVKAI
jgi:transcriptional regulator with XRE-family HTH domain